MPNPPIRPIVTADANTVRSMAMAIRLPIMTEWPGILKVIRKDTGRSVAVITDSDISDELACVAVVFAAHTVLARGANDLERQIAEEIPKELVRGPGLAFVRLPIYWHVAEVATAAGTDLTAALTASYMEWLEAFVAAQPGTATLDPLREILTGVVSVLLTSSLHFWDLDAVARMNAMMRAAEAQWPELRRH